MRIRVLRVITRMNIGGPAYHVSLLSGCLDPDRYDTLLVAGALGRGEGSFEDLALDYGARLRLLRSLSPAVDPQADLRALCALRNLVRGFRPHIVHTHTAKAGALGRIAALGPRGRRPVIVHTYHGHVLEDYFGPVVTAVYRNVERGLALFSDRLIGVSRATVEDLVRLRVAPPQRFSTVPLGLDLRRFLALGPAPNADARYALGIAPDEVMALYAGRLVHIKKVSVLLRAVACARAAGAPLRLVVLGDGELRTDLESLARELRIADYVKFAGYVRDVEPYVAAADLAVLSSASEGTPVSLIEAGAAGRPLVSTRVGGVPEVVAEGTGRLIPAGDAQRFGAALADLAGDAELRRKLGARARAHVRERYSSERLLTDVDGLYRELLSVRDRRYQRPARL